MNGKFSAYLLLGLAALVAVLALLTLVAFVRAFTVGTTLAAIESGFGTFVLLIILMVAARRLFDAGLKRLKTEA